MSGSNGVEHDQRVLHYRRNRGPSARTSGDRPQSPLTTRSQYPAVDCYRTQAIVSCGRLRRLDQATSVRASALRWSAMSLRMMARVWELPLPPTQKFVLMAIADE